jgi:hypothetical protein
MNEDDAHEDLAEALRSLFARIDPVPASVIEAGNAAYSWRRIDAELAELQADSAIDEESLALARGGGAPMRSVRFGVGGIVIDLEIHIDQPERTILGQLSPPSSAHVEIHRTGNRTPITNDADTLGRFRARIPTGGPIRLRITGVQPSRGPAVPVETSWIVI